MMFGMVLQENITVDEKGNEVKKAEKIKTREGKSTKLSELLDEAKDRALKAFEERQKKQNEESKESSAQDEEDMAGQKVQIS